MSCYLEVNSMDGDNQAISEYAKDILAWLKIREGSIPEFKRQSPQINKRRFLIEWTSVVAEKLKLTNCTVHLAVKMLDFFMDGHDIQNPQLYLVCLVSLLLASKLEEKDAKIPKCSELNAFLKNHFPLSDFISLEIVMLKYFKWNLLFPTACNFAEIWLSHAIHPNDCHNQGPLISYRDARAYFHQYVKYFLDLSMQDPSFIDIRPSLLGASLLAAARIAFGLGPQWPHRLEAITGYSFECVQNNVVALMNAFKLDNASADDVEDEGYASLLGSPEKIVDDAKETEELMET